MSEKPSETSSTQPTRIATNKLRTNPNNPRTIRKDQLEKLVKSLREFPEMLEARPIVVDPDYVVLGGNMRLKAAQEAGLTEVPVYVATWEEAKHKEFVIKDNLAFGEWDWDMLANEWDSEELDDWGLDVPLEDEPTEGLTDPDEVPEVPDEPTTKPGDLWILGEHRLLCGDSTKAEDVERLMNGNKADMVFTSPPYNSGNGGYKTDYKGKTKRFYTQDSDNRTEEEWIEFSNNVLTLCRVNMASIESPIVWNVMYTAKCRRGYGVSLFCGDHGLKVHETICWDKGHGFPTASGGILSRNWELIFVLSEGEKYNTTQGKNEVRWAKWDITRPEQQETHKATFPVELAQRAIVEFLYEGRIFDPFLGSGTTLIAAEKTGRKCYGMELDPKYCDVIVKRWEDFTGKKAELWKQ